MLLVHGLPFRNHRPKPTNPKTTVRPELKLETTLLLDAL